jgi:glyoxylase-like metal-dependent hydrolase (beta-lactamase superfamily II)
VLETPGHTRDSLSFFIPELEMLILNETPGFLLDGNVYPCYLTSYKDAVNSIEKCRRIPYKFLSLPHRGVAGKEDVKRFFDKALESNIACRDFILSMAEKNPGEDKMLELYTQRYASDRLFSYQPKEAFIANARATIACTLREFS